jgi:hypothetical protein
MNCGASSATQTDRNDISAFAPIALFLYRRRDLLDPVLDSLEACPEFGQSPVFLFSDGPRSARVADDVDDVRDRVRERLRSNMQLIESPINKGLARSISEGVSQLTNQYGRVIVLEDDLILSPATLSWFNTALDRYAGVDRVMQVSGHMFDSRALRRLRTGVFLPLTTSWGWATWKRAWSRFDQSAAGWEALASDRKLRRRFDIDGHYPYARMLEKQMRGKIDSWAIRWYWTVFQAGGLTLFPPQSLVQNLGADASATHPGPLGRMRRLIPHRMMPVRKTLPSLPEQVSIDLAAFEMVGAAIDQSPLSRLLRLLSS